jgi:hypothetical protein
VRLPFFTTYSVSAVAVFMPTLAYHPCVLPARARIRDEPARSTPTAKKLIQAGDGKFYRYPMTIRFIQ